MKFSTMILAITTLLAVIYVPGVRASEFDKKTIVTFHESMEIPGMILPAGDYVVKRADRSLPDVVRSTDATENHIYATVFAMPTYRPVPSDKVVLITEERAASAPEAIKKWFYPGDTVGAEFIYPKSRSSLMAMNTPSAKTSASGFSSQPTASSSWNQTGSARPAAVENAQSEMREESGSSSTQTLQLTQPQRPDQMPQDELPWAASNLQLLSLFGLLCAGGGLGLRKFSRYIS